MLLQDKTSKIEKLQQLLHRERESHHAERISIASVKGVNRAILDRRAKLASELSRRA